MTSACATHPVPELALGNVLLVTLQGEPHDGRQSDRGTMSPTASRAVPHRRAVS